MSFDIHFQPIPVDLQRGGGTLFTFGFKSAVGVQGPQKLINRWVKCFLTPAGSDPYDPAIGTGFANLIDSNMSNFQDVRDAVALFIDDCNAQIFAWDRQYLPPSNEQLLNATLTQITPTATGDGFDAWVKIQNAANDTAVIQLPTIASRT